MAKRKKQKEKHLLSTKEFIFNLISLLTIIGIGVYFGYRSLYYYSKQNQKIQEDSLTLNGSVLQTNAVVTEGDGLYKDLNGYYFRGNVINNYVLLDNRLFRIVRVSEDGTVRLVSDCNVATFPWGEDTSYQTSNVRSWLEKSDDRLSGVYYDTFSSLDSYGTKTKYSEDIVENNKITVSKKSYEDTITTLGIEDYTLSGGMDGYLNIGKMFFLMGFNEEGENLYVEEDGSVQVRDSLDGYGVRSVITLKADIILSSGNGTADNPYVIPSKDKNYVDTYVKMGEDIYKVFYQDGEILKLYLNGYITINGEEVLKPYSDTNSIFDVEDDENIGYYLNHDYLESLSYQDKLIYFNSFIGEFGEDSDYDYFQIYTKMVPAKVGLLNLFDYVSNNELDDYFRINTTSEVGSMEYNVRKNGFLEESEVSEEKHIVPVVSISTASIHGGAGTLKEPYVLE